jgi:hypothetical protein
MKSKYKASNRFHITEKRFLEYLKKHGYSDVAGNTCRLYDYSTEFNIHLTANITKSITMIFTMVRESYLASGRYGYATIQHTDIRKHPKEWHTHLFPNTNSGSSSNDYQALLELDLRKITDQLIEAESIEKIQGGEK